MATTDARTGFRLPWSSDPRPDASETTESPADADAAGAPATNDESGAPRSAALEPATDAAPRPESSVEVASATTTGPEPTRTPAPRRPSKFLADLTKAMQTAAEAAREEALGRLQADAKVAVEDIHGRSSSESDDLRRRADEDVTAIREWSKQEIARIREETDRKVSDRKAQLEREIDDHAALIERQIDHIQSQVAAFEAEMTTFFERLLAEEDPTRFAEMAESLPEPPPLEELTAWATAATPPTNVAANPATEPPTAEQTADAVTVPVPDEATADFGWPATDTTPVAETSATEAPAPADANAPIPSSSFTGEPDLPTSTDDAQPPAEDVSVSGSGAEGPSEETLPAATADSTSLDTAYPIENPREVEGSDQTPAVTPAGDPRLTAIGITADFDAAEAEAAAAVEAGGEIDDIPEIGDEALAARLAGLVTSSDNSTSFTPATQPVATRVVVNGLVSVASIASFKRHLGRLGGVQSVAVSSGPEGEFVFDVSHSPDLALHDVIPGLPGFQARVTGRTDDSIEVMAHDPDAEG